MKKSLTKPSVDHIENLIRTIRSEKIIIDADLAQLYGVETKVLVQAVKRNLRRFPTDFMFRLTEEEFGFLRSQFVTSKGRGGRRHLPYAFTEHGVLMAANVLNSERAVQASVQIVRTFVKLRQIVLANADLVRKLTELEKKYDAQFNVVFEAIRQLMMPPLTKRKQIGFQPKSLKR
jgi:phage regulator Rha-like protein